MPTIAANGIQIAYDTFGDPGDPALLLTIGLGCQMIYWDDPLCRRLSESGLFVIRYDNRDTGLSTWFEAAGEPDMGAVMAALAQGTPLDTVYTINDMADDAVGLLHALGIEQAHICGMSMGAIISQVVAIRHPAKTVSLIPIYGTTGDPDLPSPDPDAMKVFFEPVPTGRADYIERLVRDFKILAGPGFAFDEPWHRDLAGRAFDRAFYPQGTSRNMVAVMTAGSRKAALAALSVPTLVIHGADDPIVPVAGGRDIARTVPGAELMVIDGMGHDLPHDGAWLQITDRIVSFLGQHF